MRGKPWAAFGIKSDKAVRAIDPDRGSGEKSRLALYRPHLRKDAVDPRFREPDPIPLWSPHGTIVTVNQAAQLIIWYRLPMRPGEPPERTFRVWD